MELKNSTNCEPIELKPVKYKVPQFPSYPESNETNQSVTLNEKNDPDEFRCELASLFGGELTTGRWKHFLSDDDFKYAPRRYRRTIKDAGWRIGLENHTGDLKYTYARRDVSGNQHNLIIFFYQESEVTHVLSGYRKE